MSRFDKYMKAAKEQKAFEKEQEILHTKYDEIEEDKVIVETTNSYKFTVNFLKNFMKTLSAGILIILASIGLLTILYPNIRMEFFNVADEILRQIKTMI